MAERLAIRTSGTELVSSLRKSPAPIGTLKSNANALGWSKQAHVHLQLSIRQRQPRQSRREPNLGFGIRAGQNNVQESNSNPSSISLTLEDWHYLGKFFVACTGGAGLVKYGSVLVPDITQPNLVQALVMITAPVIVSVVLLSYASSSARKTDLE